METAIALNRLGWHLKVRGQYSAADTSGAGRSLAIREKHKAAAVHGGVLVALSNLAENCCFLKKHVGVRSHHGARRVLADAPPREAAAALTVMRAARDLAGLPRSTQVFEDETAVEGRVRRAGSRLEAFAAPGAGRGASRVSSSAATPTT